MTRHKKRYGYTTALWERGQTVPSLFYKLSLFKNKYRFPTSSLWTAMVDASYMPWPLRRALALLRNRDERGDLWNMCHFWSNFEIAYMDFFRGDAYRAIFEYLDRDGGFYYVCTYATTEQERARGVSVPKISGTRGEWREQTGCRCKCDDAIRVVEPVCLNRIGLTTS